MFDVIQGILQTHLRLFNRQLTFKILFIQEKGGGSDRVHKYSQTPLFFSFSSFFFGLERWQENKTKFMHLMCEFF